MNKKRIFIAFPASVEFQRSAMEFSLKHAQLPVRWLEGKNLHITLVPPMDVAKEELKKLVEQLKYVRSPAPFKVQFNEVGFGGFGSPALLWVKGDTTWQIEILKGGIEKAIGYEPTRKFTMHITLARFPASQFQSEWINHLKYKVNYNFTVDKFVIMESVKRNGITDYPILHEFKFA